MAARDRLILSTERLDLRPIRADDLPRLRELIDCDPAVVWDQRPLTVAESAARHTGRVDDWSRGWGMWTVIDRATDGIVGRCGFQPTEEADGVEIGYYLGQPAWGRGLATEAVTAALRWADEHLPADWVEAAVRPGNLGSQAVLAKTGFTFDEIVEYLGERVQRWTRQRQAHS
jgi:[ribosomal protein S5]-alanine N-acetyltransferase